ncbi:MAG: dihydroorotase [Thermodesulfobacteriota bacterium]|nr:dihydroorotase [Thermodesulfobacteriota bacterium]
MNLYLKGARIVDPSNLTGEAPVLPGFRSSPVLFKTNVPCDIYIRNGKIASIAPQGKEPIPADARVIDLAGKIVTPGLIDMHTHLREPGEEYKETIATGCLAAVSGGFTAIACMPNTKPVNDNKSITEYILRKAQEARLATVYPIGAISKGLQGETLAEFGDMRSVGIAAVTDDGRPVMNGELMRRALEYARNFDLPVISHCEDLTLYSGGVMNEGSVSTQLGLPGIPAVAEEVMVFREIRLAALTASSVHIAHVSTRGSVDLIRQAKASGINVTAETAPHYFSLTEEAVTGYDTNAKMNPPLRTAEDVAAIIEGLKDGTIDAIASDHAPHSILEKEVEFNMAANGIVGLETALPLTLKLVHTGHLSLSEAVAKLSTNPSRILRLEIPSIQIGQRADLTIIDPDRKFIVDIHKFQSRSKNSPFHGWELKGKAVMTIINGRIVFNDLD